MVNTQGAQDLRAQFSKLSTAEREELAAKASERPKPQVHAFAVVIHPGGAAQALPDVRALEQFDVLPATVEEVFNGAHTVVSDLQATKTAQVLMTSMQQQAHAAMSSAENQRLVEELRRKGAI